LASGVALEALAPAACLSGCPEHQVDVGQPGQFLGHVAAVGGHQVRHVELPGEVQLRIEPQHLGHVARHCAGQLGERLLGPVPAGRGNDQLVQVTDLARPRALDCHRT
jgi:hypothetical protein